MNAQLENARTRLRMAEDRQMRAMTVEEFIADQAVIDRAQREIDKLEGRRV